MTEYDLEQHIDQHGMTPLLIMIVNVCHKKANQVNVNNWLDRAAASAWRRGARHLELVAFENWPL